MCYSYPGPRCAKHINEDNVGKAAEDMEQIPTPAERKEMIAAYNHTRLVLASDLSTPLVKLTAMQWNSHEPRAARIAACKNLHIRHPFLKTVSVASMIWEQGMRPEPIITPLEQVK